MTKHDVELVEGHYYIEVRDKSVRASSAFSTWAEENHIPLTCSGDPVARYLLWCRPEVEPIVMVGYATQPGYVWKYYVTFRYENDALLYKLTFR